MSPDFIELVAFMFTVLIALFIGIFGYKFIDAFGANRNWWD